MFRLGKTAGVILVFFLPVAARQARAAAPGQIISAGGSGWVKPWLRLVTSATLYGLPNTTIATPIRVRVTDQNGNVLRNSQGQIVRVPVNFRVVAAPTGATGQRLTPGNGTSITVYTNTAGYTSASLVLGNKNGVYRLAITEPYTYYTIDWVRALTPGATASLQFTRVDTTSRTANGIDVSTVTVRARDYQGATVTGARILLGTRGAEDHKQVFSTIESGGGLYTGRTTSTLADNLTLTAWDRDTNAKNRSTSSPIFIAGRARRVDIYAMDGPGGTQPVDYALVFALALDSFENAVGPPLANVRFTTDFGTIVSTATAANEWTAWVYSATAGVANVRALDTVSGTSNTRTIVFPGSPAPSPSVPGLLTVAPYQNHHIKIWKPKGADVTNLIAGWISGKRIVYGVKSPMLGGPNIYITYAVNEYDFSKVDKDGNGLLEEFKDPAKPTEEEKNLLRNCAASVENVFIVPGMSDNSLGEHIPGGGVVINQGVKAPPGQTPPKPHDKTLAHENTHYWDLNAGDHTEGGKALPADNIGTAHPRNASLKCTNKDILTQGQLDKMKKIFPKQSPGSFAPPAKQGNLGNLVYAGSTANRIVFTFTNYTAANAPLAPLSALRANVVLSSPTFTLNVRPTSTTLTPSSLGPGQSASATFTFDVSPNALPGTGCMVELAVTCSTGEVFPVPVTLELAPPPTAGRNWRYY